MNILCCLLVCGCASRPVVQSQAQGCIAGLNALDRLASQYAGTLQGERVPGRSWLRSNRWLYLRAQQASNDSDRAKVLRAMNDLAQKALAFEVPVIKPDALDKWRSDFGVRKAPLKFASQCSQQMLSNALASPEKVSTLLKAVPPDEDYSTISRVLGAYPLVKFPFKLGVLSEQRQLRAEWSTLHEAHETAFTPKLERARSQLSRDMSAADYHVLLQHAPVWRIDNTTPANQPGTPEWRNGQLLVNQQRPATFVYLSNAWWQGQPLRQLNYVLWFSERPPLKRFDWVAGKHDAVVYRVNLTKSGKVVARDSIHLCGCWYRLFLEPGIPYVSANGGEPVLMQRVKSGQRMSVHLSADTHQITGLAPVAENHSLASVGSLRRPYEIRHINELLSLKSGDTTKPVFNRMGYVPGSQRPERWFFWPMGVKNPGAVRRIGDHAISFIGKRYFDDPLLLEKLGVGESEK